jgi:hypothetical protein
MRYASNIKIWILERKKMAVSVGLTGNSLKLEKRRAIPALS